MGIPNIPNAETILLAHDYITFRLAQHDFEWEDSPASFEVDDVRFSMRELCEITEEDYGTELS